MNPQKTGPEIVSSVIRHVRRSGRSDFGNWCIGVAESTPTATGPILCAEAYNESEARTVVHHLSREMGMQSVGHDHGKIVFTYPKGSDNE